jgi:pimeloyl-ACP methyl ester carboxylesterase
MLESNVLRVSLTRRQSIISLLVGGSLLHIPTHAGAREAKRRSDKSHASAPWLSLPPTPGLPTPSRQGVAPINGAQLFFAQFGSGPQVLLLHGGLANSNYWAHQIDELSRSFSVTVMDTRGHGRSPVTSGAFSYELFARDVIGLLDFLEIPTTSVVGWSDGAITGIQLALTRPDRLSSLFAFGANANTDGLKAGGARTGAFASFSARCPKEYLTLSPHPERWPELRAGLGVMWRTEPNFLKTQLANIRSPVTIADGEYDEIIKPEHTRKIASDIKGSSLVILPNVSHFAMLQNPAQFNQALRKFLLSAG